MRILNSLSETKAFGELLGKQALPGDIICLDGDLGAGKTTLTQAIAIGLGVPSSEYVVSPSFAIMLDYPGRIPLYHMDLYRLSDENELFDLGFEEYFHGEGLTVIEWPKIAEDIIPENRLKIIIKIKEETKRELKLDPGTSNWLTRI